MQRAFVDFFFSREREELVLLKCLTTSRTFFGGWI